jgi:hypothetical protein
MNVRLLNNVVVAAEAVYYSMIEKMVVNSVYVTIRNKALVAYVEVLCPNPSGDIGTSRKIFRQDSR